MTDLPDPLSPIMPTVSPAWTAISTPRRAWASPKPTESCSILMSSCMPHPTGQRRRCRRWIAEHLVIHRRRIVPTLRHRPRDYCRSVTRLLMTGSNMRAKGKSRLIIRQSIEPAMSHLQHRRTSANARRHAAGRQICLFLNLCGYNCLMGNMRALKGVLALPEPLLLPYWVG
ncbi:hypothetical protein BQ8482_290106 [Mesorhizobium delmotii]|uniref:Uncharacterized protein n=1 Tax=Mesorhizobium delmotii TaxID=1631247 RepID=A0A2P9AN05_9HYPH|nr:hypothetical protein BQ8482_290106 [Mesorhizobium delmotii]